jgi:hypothetical protein
MAEVGGYEVREKEEVTKNALCQKDSCAEEHARLLELHERHEVHPLVLCLQQHHLDFAHAHNMHMLSIPACLLHS